MSIYDINRIAAGAEVSPPEGESAGPLVPEGKQKAIDLHCRIMAQGQQVAVALVEFCRLLKEMRDSGLYTELGYDSFETYTEGATGLKTRMAYYYISTYERLGPDFIEENSALGITKLRLLAEVAPLDRADFLEDNDLAGMSVEDIRAAVKERDGLREQLSMFQTDGPPEDEPERDNWLEDQLEAEKRARAKAEEEKEALEKVLEEFRVEADEPVTAHDEAWRAEVAEEIRAELEEKSQAALDKAVKEAAKTAKQEAKEKAERAMEKQLEEARAAAADEARAAARQEMEAQLEAERQEKEAAAKRAADLEKQLNLTASTETTAFTLHFDALQQAFLKCMEVVAALEKKGLQEAADKQLAALKHALETLAAQI